MAIEKYLFHQLLNAKWLVGGVFGFSFVWWNVVSKPSIHAEVYGMDGNGGRMLKIITDLTDEEMARMKHRRRLDWHFKGARTFSSNIDPISDQELSDRGIKMEQEPYVEYIKRPPHDKYL
jgi:hypothetical protein